MHRTSWLWLLLVLLCISVCGFAIAENTSYSFAHEGVRFYLPTDWQVLTPENLDSKQHVIQKMGTTPQALAASFSSSGTILAAFPEQSGQIQVQRHEKPAEIEGNDIYAMTTEQKDNFLLQFARSGGYAHGAWSPELPEFAIFRGSTTVQTMSVQTIAYATVRYNKLYTITVEIIGREPTAQDEAVLFQTASSLLFLGAQWTPQPSLTPAPMATLAPIPSRTPAPAQVRVQRDETQLTLDDAPSVVETSSFTVSGSTEPNTSMRYYVNDTGYERFTSDDQGRFTFTVSRLPKDGKNIIDVYAIGEKGYGVVSFTVVFNQTKAAMAVTQFEQGVAGSSAIVTGSVKPGASVQVLYRSKIYDADVAEDGTFSSMVDLPRIGENIYTVRATMPGYLRNDQKLTIIRLPSEADEQEAFQKKVKKVAYEKLAADPDKYKNAPVQYQGKILALSGNNGQPMAVIAADGGQNPVAVLCTDLHGLELDQEVIMLCTLTGSKREVSLAGGIVTVPEAVLHWVLP